MRIIAFGALFSFLTINFSMADVTFKVDDVAPAKTPLKEEITYQFIKNKMGRPESFDRRLQSIVTTSHNPFVATIEKAYADHRPVSISPDHVWLLICQGFALHVNQNPEKYRRKLVKHAGKEGLVVERHSFIKGRIDNDWEGVFPEFCEKMKPFLTEKAQNLILKKYTTTGPVESAAYNVVMMDAT